MVKAKCDWQETIADYCDGCSDICEPVVNEQVPIGQMMHYFM